MSKGSKARPISIPKKDFESEWDRIFNKPKVKKDKKDASSKGE
jgi:hypothetical protein